MKTYRGRRIPGTGLVIWVDDGKEGSYTLDPKLSLKLRNHSPTGFEMGYSGSGPAQLALAILLDGFGRKIAEERYQDFKSTFIATFTGEGFVVDHDEIKEWLIDANAFKGRKKNG